jgi:hypothetical protein
MTLLPPDPRDTDPKVPDDWDDVWTVAYFDGYCAGYLEGRSFVPPFGFARHRPGLIPMFLSAIAGAVMASLVWAAVTHAGPVGPPSPEPSFAPVPTMPGEVRTVPSAPALLATPTPHPTPKPTSRPTSVPVARGHVRTGTATWYAANGLIAAVPGWHWGDRPYRVLVTYGGRSVIVTVQDCLCGRTDRLIDLSDDAFRRLAPLSVGVIRVSVVRL